MVMIKGSEENVRDIDSSELLERFVLETIIYRERLLEHNKGSPYHSVEEINKGMKERYMKRTKLLREELDRRLKY